MSSRGTSRRRLPFPDNKFACEVFLSYLSGFFRDPALKPNLLNAAEIVKFHIMWVLRGLVGCWCEKGAWEIGTVAAELNFLGLDTIQGCTPLRRQMIMLSILPATPLAGNFPLCHSHFGMNQFGKFIREVVFIKLAIEAIQSTGCR